MKRILVVLVVLVAVAIGTPMAGRALLWKWEQNPVLRGRILAERKGCNGCHRPFAGREIPNPGSRWGSVPAFEGGNAVMYASNRDEIGEFIRDGAPRKWLESPEVRHRVEAQAIRMPAWKGTLSDREIADLVAWACAAGEFQMPGDEKAKEGRELARDLGCTACHGVEGSGGVSNPGSLGGFIPGFAGRNFLDLVRDEAEFREWVRTGTSRRLERNPLVKAFWRRQKLKMPSLPVERLSEEDLGRLWSWVEAVRASSPAGK